jgi:hypothetical protein
MTHPRRLPTVIALAGALVLTSFAACAGTPGRAIEIAVLARARPAAEGAPLGDFTTSTGWHVTLDAAHVALSALRVQPADGSLATLRAQPADGSLATLGVQSAEGSLAALGRVLVPIAHAHGGHGAEGAGVRAELLGAMDVDALAPASIELGVARGTAGPAGTLALELGRFGDAGAAVATLSGRAERDGVVVELAGELALGEGELGVEGLPLEAELDADGALVLELRVDRWLDQARFERLAPAGDAGISMVRAGDQVSLAWALGLRDPHAFTGTWEPRSEDQE